MLKDIKEKGMPGISVGDGSISFKAETHTKTIEAVGSNLLANNDIHITVKKDIVMKGSQAIGKDVSMKAGENITLSAEKIEALVTRKKAAKAARQV